MKITKVDRRIERDIVIGLIVDKGFTAQIARHLDLRYLKNAYSRTIAKWCLDYYDKYNDVPFKKIEDIYELHNRKGEVEEDEVSMIEKLLETVNRDYTQKDTFNSQFLLDLSQEYLNKTRIENAILRIREELEGGTVANAQEVLVEASKPVSLTARTAIDPLADPARVMAAFDNRREPIVKLPGDIGELMNEQLARGSFVAIQAPEKGGKTWLLDWMKRVALEQGKKVLNVQLGDLMEDEVIVRDAISIEGRSNIKKWCGTFKMPLRFVKSDERDHKECEASPEGWDVEYEEVTIKSPLTGEEAARACRKWYKKNNIIANRQYKLIAVPARTMNIKMLDIELDKLYAEEGFIPDVIVIDYMDLLKKENSRDDGRDAINENWIEAKALANKRQCLVIAATQADATSYDGKLQSKMNFSNDKRKYGHVNGMYGLNQTNDEKKYGLNKINTIVARSGHFVESEACYLLQCLRIGRPVIDSVMPSLHTIRAKVERQERTEDESNKKVKNRLKRTKRIKKS